MTSSELNKQLSGIAENSAAGLRPTARVSIQVFDPPMCCSTGVCGPVVDPLLPQFAADMEWLVSNGVHVERYNLVQQPDAFAANRQVQQALAAEGTDCLPLILVNGVIVCKGGYAAREQLARWAGLQDQVPKSIYTDVVAELVAIGAAIASNCEPCFKFHFDRARKLGVSKEDMYLAVKTAQMVKDAPARAMLDLADRFLSESRTGVGLPVPGQAESAPKKGCCG